MESSGLKYVTPDEAGLVIAIEMVVRNKKLVRRIQCLCYVIETKNRMESADKFSDEVSFRCVDRVSIFMEKSSRSWLFIQAFLRNGERIVHFEGSVGVLRSVPPRVWGTYAGMAVLVRVQVDCVVLFGVLG